MATPAALAKQPPVDTPAVVNPAAVVAVVLAEARAVMVDGANILPPHMRALADLAAMGARAQVLMEGAAERVQALREAGAEVVALMEMVLAAGLPVSITR